MSQRPNLWIVLGIVIAVWGVSELLEPDPSRFLSEEEIAAQDIEIERARELRNRNENTLSQKDRALICRAAVAALMGKQIKIVSVTAASADTVRTKYIRSSDNSSWSNACRIGGNRVIWASITNGKIGRWRNDPADVKVTFDQAEDSVVITQTFTDGSELKKTFYTGE